MAKPRPIDPQGIFEYRKRVKLDITNATNVNADIPDLAIPIRKGEVWAFEAYLLMGCDNTGGINFALSVPANVTHKTNYRGTGSASTNVASGNITGSSSTGNMNTVNFASGSVILNGIIDGSDPANVADGIAQLRFKSGTNGQTSSVFANSYLLARRIA
jgi:hypothetical protein